VIDGHICKSVHSSGGDEAVPYVALFAVWEANVVKAVQTVKSVVGDGAFVEAVQDLSASELAGLAVSRHGCARVELDNRGQPIAAI